jgi:hypothetical protein
MPNEMKGLRCKEAQKIIFYKILEYKKVTYSLYCTNSFFISLEFVHLAFLKYLIDS